MENRGDPSLENGVSLEMNFLDIYENGNSEKKRRLTGEKRGSHWCDHAACKRSALHRRGASEEERIMRGCAQDRRARHFDIFLV